jgi:hypothetical protein
MEENNTLQDLRRKQDNSEKIIEEKTGKSWSEWERILEMTDIVSANQQEFIADVRESFNLDGLTAALLVIHYKSKHRLPILPR